MNQSTKDLGDVLLVPRGLYGHAVPFLNLGRWIVQRGPTCTVLMEEMGRWPLKRNEEKVEGLHVEWMPTLPSTGFVERLFHWRQGCEAYFEKILRDRAAVGRRLPVCMIVDQFGGWTQEWAAKLNMRRYVFVSSPATFAYWEYRYASLIRKDRLLERIHEDPVLDLPGAPALRLSECPQFSVEWPELFSECGDSYQDADGLLINTFYDVEPSVIDSFESQLKANRGDDGQRQGGTQQQLQVLPVGPISLYDTDKDKNGASKGSTTDVSCIQWLDSHSRAPVVYIAFGSSREFDLSKAQLHELAGALEATEVNFLWILIPPSNDSDVSTLLPAGFQARTKERGLVYPFFSPQPLILAHPAIKAFLTHCGWNSALESISRGVPLIAWPRHAEQRLCYRVLESAGVATGIAEGIAGVGEGVLVGQAELEKGIRTWISSDGPGSTKLLTRASELQRKAQEAVAAGGSSHRNLEDFVRVIRQQGRSDSVESRNGICDSDSVESREGDSLPLVEARNGDSSPLVGARNGHSDLVGSA